MPRHIIKMVVDIIPELGVDDEDAVEELMAAIEATASETAFVYSIEADENAPLANPDGPPYYGGERRLDVAITPGGFRI